MLTAKPANWWSWNYTVSDGHAEIAALSTSGFRARGRLDVQGKQYEVMKEGTFSPSFYLKEGQRTIIEASGSGLFTHSFTWTLKGMPYTLRTAAWHSAYNFTLVRSETPIGSIRQEHWYNRKAIIDIPPDIPLEIQLFAFWLVVLQWKKNSSAST
jgi:hypothetical protein